MLKHISTDNLETSTAQEVFDFVAHHLLTQMEQSKGYKSNTTSCLYRNSNGLMCAAGCLLTEEQAEEADGLSESSWEDVVADGIVSDAHMELITDLQTLHDNRDPTLWLQSLAKLAHTWSLSTAVLDQFKIKVPSNVD